MRLDGAGFQGHLTKHGPPPPAPPAPLRIEARIRRLRKYRQILGLQPCCYPPPKPPLMRTRSSIHAFFRAPCMVDSMKRSSFPVFRIYFHSCILVSLEVVLPILLNPNKL